MIINTITVAVGFVLITLVLFLAVWKFEVISYIYDIRVTNKGIEFILFSFLKIYFLPFSEVEHIEKTRGGYNILFVFNFKNRLFHTTYLVHKKRGIFTKDLLISPKDADEFEKCLVKGGVVFKDINRAGVNKYV